MGNWKSELLPSAARELADFTKLAYIKLELDSDTVLQYPDVPAQNSGLLTHLSFMSVCYLWHSSHGMSCLTEWAG